MTLNIDILNGRDKVEVHDIKMSALMHTCTLYIKI